MISSSLDGLGDEVETLIVGSGPAGLTLALELARQGRPSVVLESGVTAASAAQDLSAATIVTPSWHDDMSIAVARRLGGTSNLWGGRCVPLDPIDFEPRAYTNFTKWPIQHADLDGWYEVACRYVDCGAPIFDDSRGREHGNTSFSFAKLERASNQPRFAMAYGTALRTSGLIDLRLDATLVDIQIGDDGRVSHIIVADSAGRRVSIATKRIVLAAGGLESCRLLLSLQRRHPDLFGGSEGPLGRYYMGHMIGEIADVSFAGDDLDAAFDFFRDGNGSFVRRRFAPSAALQHERDLPNICFWPVVPPIADPVHQSGALSAVAMALSLPGLGTKLIPEAIRKRHLGGAIDWRQHGSNVIGDLPRTLAFLSKFAYQHYLSKQRVNGYFLRNRARRYGLSYSSEQSPRSDSRVTLLEETDRLGVARLAVDLRFHRDDAAAISRAHDALSKWLADRGLGRVVFRQEADGSLDAIMAKASHGTHQIGITRMAGSQREGVVDRDLRCFDIDNLFVASSAVFPTSGQANPTLSIVALAARLAERLAKDAWSSGRIDTGRAII